MSNIELDRESHGIGAGVPIDSHAPLTKALTNVPLFKSLSQQEIATIAGKMRQQTFKAGSTIFDAGAADTCFYVILSGEAEVLASGPSVLTPGTKCMLTKPTRIGDRTYPAKTAGSVDKFDPKRDFPYTFRVDADGARGRVADAELAAISTDTTKRAIAILRTGDYCGEEAILKQTLRQITVRANASSRDACVCAVLKREDFLATKIETILSFPVRTAVRALDHEFTQRTGIVEVTAKTDAEKNFIENAIMSNEHISALGLSVRKLVDAMVQVAYKRDVKDGESVMTAGELFATEAFIVASGKFQATEFVTANSDLERTDQNHLGRTCAEVGGMFGELALLHMAPRIATVNAQGPASVWCIDRVAFKQVQFLARKEDLTKIVSLINEIAVFNCLLHDERELLAETLYDKHYLKNEFIMKKGAPAEFFFIVMNGMVNVDGVLIDCHPHPKGNVTTGRGMYFGEDSLLKGSTGTHTVVAHSDDVEILFLSKKDFENILGPLKDMILHHETRPNETPVSRIQMPAISAPTSKLPPGCTLQTLKRVGVLGIGGFGYVTLEKYSGKSYALKKMSKAYIIKSKMDVSIMNEKKIHFQCDSPFIVNLYATFKDAEALYLLIEPALGGELYHTYHKFRFHGSGSKCRFYVGAALMGLEHLHSKKIMYRDLKPENMLLDGQGLCKMTDMGLAKQTPGKTYTSCGTPDYFAPEIVAHAGYTDAVDWWTLGVLCHEFLSGHAPFEASSPQQTYAKIRAGVSGVSFPYGKNYPEAVEWVKSMLNREPNERIAAKANGIELCKQHPFYSAYDFNWNKFTDQTMQVPYKPNVGGDDDLSNFQKRADQLPAKFDIKYVDPKNGWDKDW